MGEDVFSTKSRRSVSSTTLLSYLIFTVYPFRENLSLTFIFKVGGTHPLSLSFCPFSSSTTLRTRLVGKVRPFLTSIRFSFDFRPPKTRRRISPECRVCRLYLSGPISGPMGVRPSDLLVRADSSRRHTSLLWGRRFTSSVWNKRPGSPELP